MSRSENISVPHYDKIELIRHAAKCGDVRAQLQIGRYFMSNSYHDDVNKDEAVFWLQLAAWQGNCEAATFLRLCRRCCRSGLR